LATASAQRKGRHGCFRLKLPEPLTCLLVRVLPVAEAVQRRSTRGADFDLRSAVAYC
jgi:hypothetical protein